MKRIFALIMAVLMLLCLAACGGGNSNADMEITRADTADEQTDSTQKTDNVYNYGTFEVTAFNEGGGEYIYSVYLFDANISTNEGLSVGDTKDKVIEIYGDNYSDNNGEFTYKKGDTLLVIVFQNDMVLSIDFRLDV